jgi:hypothetical protein
MASPTTTKSFGWKIALVATAVGLLLVWAISPSGAERRVHRLNGNEVNIPGPFTYDSYMASLHTLVADFGPAELKVLSQDLLRRPSWLEQRLTYDGYGSLPPLWLQTIREKFRTEEFRFAAFGTLELMGTNAQPAAPALCELLRRDENWQHSPGIKTLGALGSITDEVRAMLERAARKSPDSDIQIQAALALWRLEPENLAYQSNALQKLQDGFRHPGPSWSDAVTVLEEMGTNAAPAAGWLWQIITNAPNTIALRFQPAAPCISSHWGIQMLAARALFRIEQNPKAALVVLENQKPAFNQSDDLAYVQLPQCGMASMYADIPAYADSVEPLLKSWTNRPNPLGRRSQKALEILQAGKTYRAKSLTYAKQE